MRIVIRLLIAIAVLVVLLIVAAFAIPFFFEDEILARTKVEINKNVNAKVDFADVDLSLFRSFPNFSLALENYTVTGVEEFEGITLAQGESVDLTLDLMSVISSSRPVEVKSVRLLKPNIHVLVLQNGKANYDIAKTSETTAADTAAGDYSAMKIELDEYAIEEGNLIYDDRSIGTYVEASNINHQGSGNFTIDVFDLDTETTIDALTVQQDDVSYLSKARLALDAIFHIEQSISKYTLKENALKINELLLNADGFVQLEGDNINMDLALSTPQNDFKNLLSMVPNAYIEGYENVDATGNFTLDGKVFGTYNSVTEQFPGFQLNLVIENGAVKYPDLPLGISNINARSAINSPGGSDFDALTVDVPRFSVRIGNNPIEGRFNLKTPVSDPQLDAAVDGTLKLEELAQAYPMEGIEDLSGTITADLKMNTRYSYIEKAAYDQVNMSGNLVVEGLNYKGEGYPLIRINSARAAFTPQKVLVNEFAADLGKSDIRASGSIDNILAYFSPSKTMTGDLKIQSNYFNADEWIPAEETTTTPTTVNVTNTGTTADEGVFDRFDFNFDATVNTIDYDVYKLTNSSAKGNIKPNRLEASRIRTQIGDSDIAASGVIINMFDYVFEDGILSGKVQMQSNLLNLNQFMAEDGTATAVATAGTPTPAPEDVEPILIPEKIAMEVDANIKKVVYTNMELTNVSGKMLIEDQSVVMDGVRANALGGNVLLSGSYDTKNPESPGFTFKYDVQGLDFQKSFNTLNTFQALAPIGKFINGKFSSSMVLEGELGKDMYPKLNTLDAKGFLQTINAVITTFKPLQAIGNALNVETLKQNINLENTKNWFTVENGVVNVEEFDLNVDKIGMKISGTHGLTQEMDYKIKAKVPTEMLEKGKIGAVASSGFGLLQEQAGKLGVNIQKSEFVNVQINLTGSITDPKVKLNLLGGEGEQTLGETAKGQLQDEVDKQKKALKAEAQEKIDETKAQAEKQLKESLDSAKTVVNKQVEDTKEDLKKKAQDALKDQLGKSSDSTKTQKPVINEDAIKDELEKFNPFKKKKKEGGGE